jgi:hypothetical protein
LIRITNYIVEVVMKAAVVFSFDIAPRYAEFPAPNPAGDDDMVIDVIAAGLHPRVRSQADGSHYTSTDELPGTFDIDAWPTPLTEVEQAHADFAALHST